MAYWLYDRVLEVDPEREPAFAGRATVNWVRALRREIEASHGSDTASQLESCRQFAATVLPHTRVRVPLASVFEPLFFSITNSMALERRNSTLAQVPWARPSAVVCWYYALYFSVRSTFASMKMNVKEDHSVSARAFGSTLRPKLPHPFKMVASRTSGQRTEWSFRLLDPCLLST